MSESYEIDRDEVQLVIESYIRRFIELWERREEDDNFTENDYALMEHYERRARQLSESIGADPNTIFSHYLRNENRY